MAFVTSYTSFFFLNPTRKGLPTKWLWLHSHFVGRPLRVGFKKKKKKKNARRSSLTGRERAIVSQTNIGTIWKATLGKILSDWVERIIWPFPSAQIPSWTELTRITGSDSQVTAESPNGLVEVAAVQPVGTLQTCIYAFGRQDLGHSSGAVWKSRWPSTVSVDVKQHSAEQSWDRAPPICNSVTWCCAHWQWSFLVCQVNHTALYLTPVKR